MAIKRCSFCAANNMSRGYLTRQMTLHPEAMGFTKEQISKRNRTRGCHYQKSQSCVTLPQLDGEKIILLHVVSYFFCEIEARRLDISRHNEYCSDEVPESIPPITIDQKEIERGDDVFGTHTRAAKSSCILKKVPVHLPHSCKSAQR